MHAQSNLSDHDLQQKNRKKSFIFNDLGGVMPHFESTKLGILRLQNCKYVF